MWVSKKKFIELQKEVSLLNFKIEHKSKYKIGDKIKIHKSEYVIREVCTETNTHNCLGVIYYSHEYLYYVEAKGCNHLMKMRLP